MVFDNLNQGSTSSLNSQDLAANDSNLRSETSQGITGYPLENLLTSLRLNGLRNLIETEARYLGRKSYSVLSEPPSDNTQLFDPSESKVLLSPEKDSEGHWVGGASPFYDEENNKTYLYYRLRDPYKRGWKSVIAGVEGNELNTLAEFYSEEFSAHSLEGAALTKENQNYSLFISYHEKSSGRWKIDKLTADSVSKLESATRETVEISPSKFHVKDPIIYEGEIIVHAASKYFFTISNLAVEKPYSSSEPEEVLFRRGTSGLRVTSILDIGDETFYFYDWHPSIIFTGEEKAKIGRLEDGRIKGLMPDSAITSEDGTGSLRYVKAIKVEDEVWFFYEKSAPGKSHELALHKMSLQEAKNRLTGLSK